MWLKWLPWKYVVRWLARSHGFADPVAILSYVRRFSQPSEVNEPIELLRAGAIFHARGLINSRVIQHNLDWVWPYWVNRQFMPESEAFIPRAASLTHINLSARNWTAVGEPGISTFPIIDPRGLLTPFWDSWSIDAWIVSDNGGLMTPSRLQENVEQRLCFTDGLSVITTCNNSDFELINKTSVYSSEEGAGCFMELTAKTQSPGWLVVSLRPFNPEGISFIHKVRFFRENFAWKINGKRYVFLSEPPDKHILSDYEKGDVSLQLLSSEDERQKIVCNVGLASAAAMYRLAAGEQRKITAAVPLFKSKARFSRQYFGNARRNDAWKSSLGEYCTLELGYKNFKLLYEAAIRAVVLHSPAEVYAGPFTYKRFWFRDAVYIIYAMLCAGMAGLAEKLIDNFLPKQTAFGYFHSQQGEWDSNGQVLWLMDKFCLLTGTGLKDNWINPVFEAARWIVRKRLSKDRNIPHAGLLPAGFSAEHFGPNDYYYWDDFWSAAGLKAAARMLDDTKYADHSRKFRNEADELLDSIVKSLELCRGRLGCAAMPVSPYRRLDSAAVGCLVACYPLGLFEPRDERILATTDFLMKNCIVEGGLFHDISHSGINPYLTLHLAQTLMRASEAGFIGLVETIARLASATGQWPEGINPRTGSGCMGDGQHIWACAEWILMMINSFVIESGDSLIIGAGIFPQWLEGKSQLSIGPVMTSVGAVNVSICSEEEKITISWQGRWRNRKPQIEIRLPGFEPVIAQANKTVVEIGRRVKV